MLFNERTKLFIKKKSKLSVRGLVTKLLIVDCQIEKAVTISRRIYLPCKRYLTKEEKSQEQQKYSIFFNGTKNIPFEECKIKVEYAR